MGAHDGFGDGPRDEPARGVGSGGPADWSFPCGRWFGLRVRVNVLLPVACVLALAEVEPLPRGFAVGAALCVAVLLHEFGRAFAVRAAGGRVREAHLWPLGGIGPVRPTPGGFGALLAHASGPATNLLACAACLPLLADGAVGRSLLNPAAIPGAGGPAGFVAAAAAVLWFANWLVFAVNLLPVVPLDAGRLLRDGLALRLDAADADARAARVGTALCTLAVPVGIVSGSAWLVAGAAVLLVMQLAELHRLGAAEPEDDTFLGYDFSAGYTSLERSDSDAGGRPHAAAPPPGPLRRWLEERRRRRARRDRDRALETERELDRLLEKISRTGEASLTGAERRMLRRAAARIRARHRG